MAADLHPYVTDIRFVADCAHAALHEVAHRPTLEAIVNAYASLQVALLALDRVRHAIDEEGAP
jgi:hypothetical protein